MTRNIGVPPRRPLGPIPRYLPIVSRVALAAAFVLAGLALLFLATLATPAEAQWRGHHRGGYHGGWQQRRHDGSGAFVGGIIGGVIGGMIAGRPNYAPPPFYDPVAECVRRFRSYSPELGIYYGYDGRPRRCP